MINIIREDATINPQLALFPAAKANVAIFGTQSSGKSTLLNNVFDTEFPVLDTLVTRERCTKGVWLHNINDFNVIDTEGFDSMERAPEDKLFEKQVALFCLALSDVLLVNMWMNQIGRYEASHSHILKAIIKASERVIASQNRKVIFVVRDCTDDADRKILKEELSAHMMGIIKAETKKSTLKFSLEYFMMSHYYQNQAAFKKESKELLRMIGMTRRSNLNNYADEDRIVYVRNLWTKVTSSESEIDLKTVEDALRNYALERIRQQTVYHMQDWLQRVKDMQQYKTYQRFKEGAAKESRTYYLQSKPKHLREEEVEVYINAILMTLDSKQNKKFMTELLPEEEDRLIAEEYEVKIDAIENLDSGSFKKQMDKQRKQLEETYKGIVKGLKEHAKMTRRFVDKIETKNIKYEQHLQHLQNVFKTELEAALNEEIDKQTNKLVFEESKIRKIISVLEDKHKTNASKYLQQIWDRVVYRTSNSTIVAKIKSEGEPFTTASLGVMIGNQTQAIVSHYRLLQQKAQEYLTNIMRFNNEDTDTPINYQKFELVRKVINQLIDLKVIEDTHRFKISLVFVAILMFFFFSEFKLILRVAGMSKKRLNRWIWLYIGTMLGAIGILLYRKRQYLKKFIEPL